MMTAHHTIVVTALMLTVCGTTAGRAYAQSGAAPVEIGRVAGTPITEPATTESTYVAGFWRTHGKLPDARDKAEYERTKQVTRCGLIQSQVTRAARDAEIQRRGIAVSDEDVSVLSKYYWSQHDAEAELAKYQAQNTAMADAMVRIYDGGQDAETVYTQAIAPLRVPKAAWQVNLARWTVADGRAATIRAAATARAMTVGDYRQSLDAANRRYLEQKRLDDAVDNEIAANDVQFRSYLDEWRRNSVEVNPYETRTRAVPAAHLAYLQQARAEWWRTRTNEIGVSFTSAESVASCQLEPAGISIGHGKSQ